VADRLRSCPLCQSREISSIQSLFCQAQRFPVLISSSHTHSLSLQDILVSVREKGRGKRRFARSL
jgi:hypothetical protein